MLFNPLIKLYSESISDREELWAKEAKTFSWYKPCDKVLDDSNKPFYKWFVGGQTNIVANAIDRHLDSETKNKLAIIRKVNQAMLGPIPISH